VFIDTQSELKTLYLRSTHLHYVICVLHTYCNNDDDDNNNVTFHNTAYII